jgi:hypothetical protein
VKVFRREPFIFCESIAIELVDGFGRPRVVDIDANGFPRNSRMALMFRTNDIVCSDLKQQRVKDTGFGSVDFGGKMYGRLSMPMTIHTIVEVEM